MQAKRTIASNYVIGIDIGGTRTHAVLCQDEKTLYSVDDANQPDIQLGIEQAINHLFATANACISIHPTDIAAVMVGTTYFVNNILQKKCLSKVFAIRLGKPATTSVQPAADWPLALKKLIGHENAIIAGGYEFSGEVISPLDVGAVEEIAKNAVAKTINSIAVTGVFSPLNSKQELAVYSILKRVNPNFHVSLSHQIGELGLLARENATILNAAMATSFERFRQGIIDALNALKLDNTILLFSSNNGTIENAETIFPIQTFGSGPSNSIRGAALLYKSNAKFSIVADIGGTSTDVGINKNQFPLLAGCDIKIGDISESFNCNFPAPLIFSCGLGGGSVISDNDNNILVGPESVGYQLQNQAVCFGGEILTVTDIAIAKGRVINFGKKELLVTKGISLSLIDKADDIIHSKLAEMINLAIPYIDSTELLSVILVGGGAALFDLNKLRAYLDKTIETVIVPEHAASANAVGASIAKIAGQFSKIYTFEDASCDHNVSRKNAIEHARKNAFDNAITKGADPRTITELGITETPINYLPGALHLIKAEVIGTFRPEALQAYASVPRRRTTSVYEAGINTPSETRENIATPIEYLADKKIKQFYQDLAIGAAILGSGGGGDTSLQESIIRQLLESGHVPQIIELSSLSDTAFVVAIAAMGAPSVGNEKIPSQEEFMLALRSFEEAYGKKVDAIIPAEGAGSNALHPFSVAAACGLPVINADCMGRAFPEFQMTTPTIYGNQAILPLAVLSNGKETRVIHTAEIGAMETQLRNLTIAIGGSVSIACLPMNGKQAKQWCIPNTLQFCREIGVALRSARLPERISFLKRACIDTSYGPITEIGTGRIIELHRNCDGGFNRGWVVIATQNGAEIKIEFQNEYLRASDVATNAILALVPDIITLIDIRGKAIACELLRVGLEVSAILKIGVPPLLKTPEALLVVGHEQFHLPELLNISHCKRRFG